MIGNPHAVGMVTKGILAGSTIGLTSQGYLIQITEFEYSPPIPEPLSPTKIDNSPGSSRTGQKKQERKRVVVTLFVNGAKFESQCIVDKDVKVSISNIEVIEGKSGPIGVAIKNIHGNK